MEKLQDFAGILRGEPVSIQILTGLRAFWRANKDFWFSHAPISSWETHSTTYVDTLDINMHLILHYDQIFRHPNPRITAAAKSVAFRFATSLALHILHSSQYEEAEPWERVFILLAIRHQPYIGCKELVLCKCLQEVSRGPENFWCRFLGATVWDVHCWKDKNVGYPCEPVVDSCSLHTFDGILEAPKLHSLHSVDTIMSAMESCIRSLKDCNRVAVSISGGVDSMVAAWAANEVCKKVGKELVLLHISYMNREECEDECNLVRWFGQLLDRPVYIRRITEIQRFRTSVLRAMYEEVTRRIRFGFYAHFGCPVILGHNLDDCYENVFRNLSQQIHMDNLFGMSVVGEEQGVQTLRPFLNIPKSQIIAFADSHGIPHLYDSTPTWSQRGQMRDRLIPAIRDFDPHILEGFRTLVERVGRLERNWIRSFDEWMATMATESDKITVFRHSLFFQQNADQLDFWIRFFRKLKWPRPSNKSIRNLVGMLDRAEGICILNGSIWAEFSVDNVIFVKNPDSKFVRNNI